jgi:hypothetical protein
VFGRLLGSATSGINNLLAKYAVQASLALPFVFAFAFCLAELTVVLIDVRIPPSYVAHCLAVL